MILYYKLWTAKDYYSDICLPNFLRSSGQLLYIIPSKSTLIDNGLKDFVVLMQLLLVKIQENLLLLDLEYEIVTRAK